MDYLRPAPLSCVALLSGGLDSQLAIRLMQKQGIRVQALNFKTAFTCCQDTSAQTAAQLGVELTVVPSREDYLDVIAEPQFGYGRGANPCVDCRIYMFRLAAQYMRDIGAHFVISGEVVGQRPMSQKRRDLDVIAYHSGLDELLLRPLSAKRLPPTLPERRGWVDREQLYGIVGRSRKHLIQLARDLGLPEIPAPSTGCALTEVQFSRKVFDLLRRREQRTAWDFQLLKLGRHFRFDDQTKVVVGRRAAENDQLRGMHERMGGAHSMLLVPDDFRGPVALLIGSQSEAAERFAAGLIWRYARPLSGDGNRLRLITRGQTRFRIATSLPESERAETLSARPLTKRRRKVRPSSRSRTDQTPWPPANCPDSSTR